MSRPRVVVTNDDGIEAEGIRRLAQALLGAGAEVLVAAPDRESSGSSAALLAVESEGRVVVERRELEGLDVEAYAVAAKPAFIALLASRGAFGRRPDFLASGANHGPNVGQAVLHSGTVGAALTAASHDIPSMAVSMAVGAFDWPAAEALAARVFDHLRRVPPRTVLNLNVPAARDGRSMPALVPAVLAEFGAVQMGISEVGEGYVTTTMTDTAVEAPAGSDLALLDAGYATITALGPLCPAGGVDLSSLVDAQPSLEVEEQSV